MRVTLLPTVALHRELYAMPRGPQRFQRYIEAMTGGTGDVVLPISMSNPMAKEHALAYAEKLLAMDAEGMARQAADEAGRRLAHVDLDLRVGIALGDDVAGGWTNRHLNDHQHRFGLAPALKRALNAVLLWLSEPPTAESVRAATLAVAYRHAHAKAHGVPRTLGEMMTQDGRALRFAGAAAPPLTPQERAETEARMRPHLASTVHAVHVACLYGDDAAREVGHAPLGFTHHAGFVLALARAHEEALAPEQAIPGARGPAGKKAGRAV